jgi:hypothetical protein
MIPATITTAARTLNQGFGFCPISVVAAGE